MPGQKISEKDIKTDIGIGRTPVREAILRLKQEGLINVIPKSGTYISLIELDRVNDALYLRRNLELPVLQEACCCTLSEEEILVSKQLIEKQEQALKCDDFSLFFKYFDQFHQMFYTVTEHPMVWKWLISINIYFYRIIVLNLKKNPDYKIRIVNYDKAILKAIINKVPHEVTDCIESGMIINVEKEHLLIRHYYKYFDLTRHEFKYES